MPVPRVRAERWRDAHGRTWTRLVRLTGLVVTEQAEMGERPAHRAMLRQVERRR